MKIIQINCVYKEGSTGKIAHDIHKGLLSAGEESIVICGRRAKKEEGVYGIASEPYAKFNNLLSRITGVMYGGCYFSTEKIKRIIKKEKPDIVHLHCINGFFCNIFRLLEFLKKNNIKTVLTLHAEFMYTANCGHAYECEKWKTGCGNCPQLKSTMKSILFDNTHLSWVKMKKAFEDFDNLIVTSVSGWLKNRAEQSPILADKKHVVVLNGVDTNIFKIYETENLRKELNLEDKKVLFHVTANFDSETKGRRYILDLAERLRGENIVFLIAGKCDNKPENAENIIFLGNVKDQEKLAKYYSLADLTVLASKRETFSMPVAESLCCGTAVVGFKAGAPEEITIPEYSKFVSHGDVDALEKATRIFLEKNFQESEISQKA